MPPGTAIHIPSEGDAFIAEHRYIPEPLKTFPSPQHHLREALRRQKMLADAARVTPDFAAAPPPLVPPEPACLPVAAVARPRDLPAAPPTKPTRPPKVKADRPKPSWAARSETPE